jgi:hypothetical protein
MTEIRAIPIDPDRLAAIRDRGEDDHGMPVTASAAEGWEPLRCCLRLAEAGEQVALISYAPFTEPSAWREVGPVYVHAEACRGFTDKALPAQLRTGPRILRTYRADGTMDYDNVTLVPEGEDVEAALRGLFDTGHVAVVHVRAMLTQCFTYAVERA